MSRVFAISDIHVDYADNLEWIEKISDTNYQHDVLLLAGDVTDKLPLLTATLKSLCAKFKDVFFVPGNHELWIRDKQNHNQTSVDKFHEIIKICGDIGVHTDAKKVSVKAPDNLSLETPADLTLETMEKYSLETPHVWIVPLFSWCATPEDDRNSSLYVESPLEDVKTKSLWMDNHMCVWPKDPHFSACQYFSDLCKDRVKTYDAPVISFSHFLPRQDLIKANEDDIKRVILERTRLGLPKEMPQRQGAMAGFNFTRYAGCSTLEDQVRLMQSKIHVFGHQHRNRDRMVDGVRYISHCLGYKREVQQGLMYGLQDGPKQVWP